MSFILTTRNPRTGELIVIVENDDGDPAEFETERAAMDAAADTMVCKAWGYNVVEV